MLLTRFGTRGLALGEDMVVPPLPPPVPPPVPPAPVDDLRLDEGGGSAI
jgi:hypothetical protein